MEPHTPSLRRFDCIRKPVERYSPPNFHSNFVLSTINDEPRFVKEVVNYEEGKTLEEGNGIRNRGLGQR